MDISIILAQVLGIVMVVLGLEMLFNGKFMSEVLGSAVSNVGTLWIMGFLTLVLGALMVTTYNVWSSSWTVIITIVGWLMFLKGILIMLFPKTMASFYRAWNTSAVMMAGGVVVLVVGVILFYVGFAL